MSARWSGIMRPPLSGEYVFSLPADDACRLTIDGNDIFTYDRSLYNGGTVSMRLEASRDYHVVAEYFNTRDYAIAQLKWKLLL